MGGAQEQCPSLYWSGDINRAAPRRQLMGGTTLD